MKRNLLILFVAVLIAIPAITFAFSWRSLTWWKAPAVVETPQTIITEVQKLSAEQKYQNWIKAVKAKNLAALISEPENFVLSEQAANYILQQELDKLKNPPIKDVYIYFNDNEIELRGYLLQPYKGNVLLKIAPQDKGDKIGFKVTKASLKGFYLPAFIANSIIEKNMKDTLDFLYTYPDYQTIEVKVTDNELKLLYN